MDDEEGAANYLETEKKRKILIRISYLLISQVWRSHTSFLSSTWDSYLMLHKKFRLLKFIFDLLESL